MRTRERQHHRPADISETSKNLSSMESAKIVISNSKVLHGTLHHPTKFQADKWKFQSSANREKNSETWPSEISICFICFIIPPHYRLKPQIWVRAVMSYLRPAPTLSWKILKFRGTRKNWPSNAIFISDLLPGTVHNSIKFQADTLKSSKSYGGNVVVRDGQTAADAWNTTISVDTDGGEG